MPLVTRGAMDDFVNDHTFEGDDVVPAVSEKKRKLVEKVGDTFFLKKSVIYLLLYLCIIL